MATAALVDNVTFERFNYADILKQLRLRLWLDVWLRELRRVYVCMHNMFSFAAGYCLHLVLVILVVVVFVYLIVVFHAV